MHCGKAAADFEIKIGIPHAQFLSSDLRQVPHGTFASSTLPDLQPGLPAKLIQDLLRRARAFGRAALHKTLVVDQAVLAGEEDVALAYFLVAGE